MSWDSRWDDGSVILRHNRIEIVANLIMTRLKNVFLNRNAGDQIHGYRFGKQETRSRLKTSSDLHNVNLASPLTIQGCDKERER